MESIPEVLEDKDSLTEQSDTSSVHDMDYVNPRGVRFTQSTQRDGNLCSEWTHTRRVQDRLHQPNTVCLLSSVLLSPV